MIVGIEICPLLGVRLNASRGIYTMTTNSARHARLQSSSARARRAVVVTSLAFVLANGVLASVPALAAVEDGAQTTSTIDSAATETPAVETPATEAPATEVPADAPTAEAPATEAPATEVPAEAPTAEAPTEDSTSARDADADAPVTLAAADSELIVRLSRTTGTPGFDADDSPGNDSSATNDVVRTNDTVGYTVSVRREGEDQTGTTITLALPKGEELIQLPPFCVTPGSSVTPADIPDPVIPVTLTSWETLPAQTITCVIADREGSSTLDYDFVAKVRPEIPDGTRLANVTAQLTSDQVTAPVVSEPVNHRVSARPDFDLSKTGLQNGPNTGPYVGSEAKCSFDTTRFCTISTYPITLNTRPGGKGTSPLQTPFTFVDDLSPEAFYGAGTTTSAAWTAAGAAAATKYGARLKVCGGNIAVQTPGSKANTTNLPVTRAVRDSGTITCSQPGGPGTPVTVSIANADTTAYTVPSENSHGGALPADSGLVISLSIQLEIPRDAIVDLGTPGANGTKVLKWTNTYTDIVANAIDGTPAVGERISNNTKDVTAAFSSGAGGVGATKFFVGLQGNPNNTGAVPCSSGRFQCLPGAVTAGDGNTVVTPGQYVVSLLETRQDNPLGVGEAAATSVVVCDTWDESLLGLAADFPNQAPSGGTFANPSNGASAWLGAWYQDGQQPLSALRNLKIQYGYGADTAAGPGTSCNTGTWADSPDAVPGAAKADGAWTGINRVRYSFTTSGPETSSRVSTHFAIGMKVLDAGAPVGTKIPNRVGWINTAGVHTMEEVLASPPQQWITSHNFSTYNAETHLNGRGDRLILGSANTSVRKYVRVGATGAFSDTAVPQFTSGSTVEYRLNPALVADADAGTREQVFLEDCLPAYQVYVSSRRESGAAIEPSVIRDGAPAGSQLACLPGQQYLRWELGLQTVNAPIDPVIYAVETLATARNGVYTNTALVSVPNDPRPVAARQDTAQVQLVTPRGIAVAKTTPTPVVEVNPAGVTTPRLLNWRIEFANIDHPVEVRNVDVVDILPVQGEGRTDYTGGLEFVSSAPVAGDGIVLRYTKQDPALLVVQPDDATNGPDGTTVWCDAPSGGAVISGDGTAADCPTAASEVTALRLFRPGPFVPSDSFAASVTMVASENAAGDVYENRVAAKAEGVALGIGPNVRSIRIVSSEVGDVVWEDADGDGVQDDGELGLPDVSVRLTGTDVSGNAVDLTTTTGADGAYLFAGLASGSYEVTFGAGGLPVNWTFTTRRAGGDAALDSDADPATGRTGPIALAANTVDHTWDAGIRIDRNVDISLTKEIVSQSEVTVDAATGSVDVRYRLTVTNAGTAAGSYDLADTLQFGAGITPGPATVTGPAGVVLTAGFDGLTSTSIATAVPIAGGATHVYEVSTSATIALVTTTTSATDCTLTEGENGTGLLNSAAITVAGETTTDDACGPVELPRSSLGDRVWLDQDADGIQDDGEPGVADVLVTLTGTDVNGVEVELTTTTDAAGNYLFGDLAAGTYSVAFTAPTGTAFTSSLVGSDAGVDSDAQPNGRTAAVVLAWGESNLTLDAGLVEVSIAVEKTLVNQSPTGADGAVTLTYEIVVTNSGRTAGTYDLADTLRVGEGITVTSASAAGPATASLNPTFSGVSDTKLVTDQAVAAQSADTYLIIVKATVATTVTQTQADCSLSVTETGTGFLNEAAVTVDGVVITDTACGPATPPVTPSSPAPTTPTGPISLPHTGAGVIGLGIGALVLLGLGGTVMFLRRRHRIAG